MSSPLHDAMYFLDTQTLLCLAVGALLSTPIYRQLEAGWRRWTRRRGQGWEALHAASGFVLAGVLTVLCAMRIASSSYDPFIYFRF